MTLRRRSLRRDRPRMSTVGMAFPKPQDRTTDPSTLPPREASEKTRRLVFARDNGVCASCGVDAVALEAEFRLAEKRDARLWDCNICGGIDVFNPCKDCNSTSMRRATVNRDKFRQEMIADNWPAKFVASYHGEEGSLWEADHETGVYDGGGSQGASNLRTLCIRCHDQTTARQAGDRAKRRRFGR